MQNIELWDYSFVFIFHLDEMLDIPEIFWQKYRCQVWLIKFHRQISGYIWKARWYLCDRFNQGFGNTDVCCILPRLAWTNPRPHLSLPRLYRSLCRAHNLNGVAVFLCVLSKLSTLSSSFEFSSKICHDEIISTSPPSSKTGEVKRSLSAKEQQSVMGGGDLDMRASVESVDTKGVQIGKSYPGIASPPPPRHKA